MYNSWEISATRGSDSDSSHKHLDYDSDLKPAGLGLGLESWPVRLGLDSRQAGLGLDSDSIKRGLVATLSKSIRSVRNVISYRLGLKRSVLPPITQGLSEPSSLQGSTYQSGWTSRLWLGVHWLNYTSYHPEYNSRLVSSELPFLARLSSFLQDWQWRI